MTLWSINMIQKSEISGLLRHLILPVQRWSDFNRSEVWIMIWFFQTDQVHHLNFKCFYYYRLTLAAIQLESTGWQEVMVNLWNFTLRPLTSCQNHVCSVGPQLAVIDATYTAACRHTALSVQMSGFWLSSKRLPHWVNFSKPTEPSRQSHTWYKNPCRSDVTPGWELFTAPSLKREGLAWSSREGSRALLPYSSMPGPSTTRQRERESAWRWGLGSEKDLWCGPSFSLGWDKPWSVAPLRLVGCLIETPAPSWAYFYSIFSLAFFFLPYSDLSCSLFFF